jgi:hypothetical protein
MNNDDPIIVSRNPYIRCSYALLAGSLVTSLVMVSVRLWAALIPASLVFGWVQIGGL